MAARERRDIEWLVNWALEGQGLGAVLVSAPQQADWTALGVRVDGGRTDFSGRGVVDGLPDHDATVIAGAITGLPQEAAALVVRFGRLGYGEFARPDWCAEGIGSMQVATTSTGKIKWDYEDHAGRRGERRPRMVFVGDRPEQVAFYRAQYELWWAALSELVPIVNLALKRHEALPPIARSRPWEGERPVLHMAG